MRHDGRADDQLRPIEITRRYTEMAAGSVLWKQGRTWVWATASVTRGVPPFFKPDRAGGWVTADYVMMPASTPGRKPWPKVGHTDSRGTEIQRLIGRCVRAAVDLSKIGPNTINLDCQILQADGGTRTASICAAMVALRDALASLPTPYVANPLLAIDPNLAAYDPSGAIMEDLSAVSVGVIDGQVRLDLDYIDDSRADVDMNVAMLANGHFVEVQGAAEGAHGFDRGTLNRMLDFAENGCRELIVMQRLAMASGEAVGLRGDV